jgi:hypothetical protein
MCNGCRRFDPMLPYVWLGKAAVRESSMRQSLIARLCAGEARLKRYQAFHSSTGEQKAEPTSAALIRER